MTIQITDKLNKKYHPSTLYVIHGSRSGNSKAAAVLAKEYAEFLGMKSELIDMQDFPPNDISHLKNILIAVSTHGEGDPPIAAENFLAYLSGDEAPPMKGSKFSVLALGDSSYRHFCKTGHDFQDQLQKLGAKKIHELVECDIDFEENAKKWIEESVNAFKEILPTSETKKGTMFTFELAGQDEEMGNVYRAKVLDKRILNNESSENHTLHLSLSLQNSGINYQVGDTIGIYSSNSKRMVDKLIKLMDFDPTHILESKNKKKMLKQALVDEYELTLLTPLVVKNYAKISGDSKLNNMLSDSAALNSYCETKDIIDLITDFPAKLSPSDFISVLRKLPSRMYSIASSQKKHPDEVHIMVRLIDFIQNDRKYEGVCSSYLSTRIDDGESIGIYLEKNEKFRLPADEIPIIMIGAGTGLAPFRAFLQERDKRNATGRNWLFFGERNASSDFYYKDELKSYQKEGLLTKLHTAFSRSPDQKAYITEPMFENSRELYEWIENGAVLYLCGNKRKLAKSVRKALYQIIQNEANLSLEDAKSYIKRMKVNKRFMEDVY